MDITGDPCRKCGVPRMDDVYVDDAELLDPSVDRLKVNDALLTVRRMPWPVKRSYRQIGNDMLRLPMGWWRQLARDSRIPELTFGEIVAVCLGVARNYREWE